MPKKKLALICAIDRPLSGNTSWPRMGSNWRLQTNPLAALVIRGYEGSTRARPARAQRNWNTQKAKRAHTIHSVPLARRRNACRAFWWLSSQIEICSRPQGPTKTAHSVLSHVTIDIYNYTFKPKKQKVANTKLCQVIIYSPRISTEIQEIV